MADPVREAPAHVRDKAGMNREARRLACLYVKGVCLTFTPSHHGNAFRRTDGGAVMCRKCNKPQARHWLRQLLEARGYVVKGKGQAISDVYDLVAEVRALRATQERLREALDEFGQHKPSCAGWSFAKGCGDYVILEKCDCGLRAALTTGSPTTENAGGPNVAYENHWRAVTVGPAKGHSNVMDGSPFGYMGCPHHDCVNARGGLSRVVPAAGSPTPEQA